MPLKELAEAEKTCARCANHHYDGLGNPCWWCEQRRRKHDDHFRESFKSYRERAEQCIAELDAENAALKAKLPASRFRCPDCDGRGQVENSIMLWCSLCGGTGAVAFAPSTDRKDA